MNTPPEQIHLTQSPYPSVAPHPNGKPEAINIDLLIDIPVQISVELGRTQMTVRQVLELERGSVIELERVAGDPVDVFVNGSLIAVGEVVVVDDRFGIRISSLVVPTLNGGK
ncbi:MAG: flagellar motor switch protein FliN [Anaerolineales bacterium]|nr:flagellar motor switch protein FliN [Anaerolineales bacterium]